MAIIFGKWQDWTWFERGWLALFTTINLILFFAWDDTILGLISSIAGMLCVVLVAKGRISNYFFGVIQTATYGYIAYTYQLYGESMLNLLFYLPAQFIGVYMWLKYKKPENEAVHGETVYAKRLSVKQWLLVVVSFVIGAVLYGWLLTAINAQQVRIDSMAVVLSVIAQILMILRFAEQWILWILVNMLTITLWVITLVQTGGNDWTMVVMWSAFLINSVYGYVNWLRIAKGQVNV
ncbi:nicotinamide riboside transporter PnuC [Metasolibacillus meyeri]|uniref:Nicotinamide riboside transporter PnuC n=1 Tax=Metasolibacillus meyeri TaxID=1071052 RepID=A0AAW9NG06_9BACL|nr:nicotinamide riboside transporter PnuC [Metasolibacillus meyeri]MEC1177514.1 nicotinamide riboside transporter PnuC [Metasolibacillus meyeri]